jgi:hypothetical protein
MSRLYQFKIKNQNHNLYIFYNLVMNFNLILFRFKITRKEFIY